MKPHVGIVPGSTALSMETMDRSEQLPISKVQGRFEPLAFLCEIVGKFYTNRVSLIRSGEPAIFWDFGLLRRNGVGNPYTKPARIDLLTKLSWKFNFLATRSLRRFCEPKLLLALKLLGRSRTLWSVSSGKNQKTINTQNHT